MIYDKDGNALSSAYDIDGIGLSAAYDLDGQIVFSGVDYTNYSYTQKWSSKGISNAQGLDIYNDLVFWVAKSGDDTIPSNCYVWNLSDGTQALDSAYVTVYSGHGNNLSFSNDGSKLIATPAYQPSRVFINSVGQNYVMSLSQTLVLDDGSTNCDACYDPIDNTIMWSLGHTAGSSDLSAPYKVSKWDLTDLTDNGDGTYTPALLQTVTVAQPSSSFYFQGCRVHDGILWFPNGNGTGRSYIYGVNPNTGEYLYTIDLETNTEPEGLTWYPDAQAVGGYALYVGFQGMMMRKYTFAST